MTKKLHSPGLQRHSLLCIAAVIFFSELLPYVLPRRIILSSRENPPRVPTQLSLGCLERTLLCGAEAGAELYLDQISLSSLTRGRINRRTGAQLCRKPPGFQTLDLIKIFGRLSGSCPVGSALVSPYVSAAAAAKEIEAAEVTSGHVAASKRWSVREWQELQQPSLLLRRPVRAAARSKEQQQQQQPWEHLFLKDNISEDKGLQLANFCQETEALEFKWPTTINTGQAPVNVRIVPVANSEFLRTCGRMRHSPGKGGVKRSAKFSWREINDFVRKETINKDALECVFRSFLAGAGSSSDRLYREDVLRCIWRWAPADGVVDWEQFLFFMDETPSDNLKGAVD